MITTTTYSNGTITSTDQRSSTSINSNNSNNLNNSVVSKSSSDDTIIAQCTPRGPGALALIRLSGSSVFSLIRSCARLAHDKDITQLASHTVHVGWLVDQEENIIDQVLFLLMRGPRTFTGQDTIEITCHNNQIIIEQIIMRALSLGARLAGPGEFTSRALLAGKLDLIQAEAIHELISAQTEEALKRSLGQLEGTLSHWLLELEQSLIKILAWSEASFEFLDEEVEFGSTILADLEALFKDITDHRSTFDAHQRIREGFRVALVGSVNAGKSSLFNLLIGNNRSIVTPIAGTTRDSIEATVSYAGHSWTYIDTAGMRATDDIIEREGVLRAQNQAHTSDLLLLLCDSSRYPTAEEEVCYESLITHYGHKTIVVYTKADLPTVYQFSPTLTNLCRKVIKTTIYTTISSDLKEQINQVLTTLFSTTKNSPFLLNERQYHLLVSLEQDILTSISELKKPVIYYELVSYQLRAALEKLTQLTGKTITEAGLDTVFKEFCVGK